MLLSHFRNLWPSIHEKPCLALGSRNTVLCQHVHALLLHAAQPLHWEDGGRRPGKPSSLHPDLPREAPVIYRIFFKKCLVGSLLGILYGYCSSEQANTMAFKAPRLLLECMFHAVQEHNEPLRYSSASTALNTVCYCSSVPSTMQFSRFFIQSQALSIQ